MSLSLFLLGLFLKLSPPPLGNTAHTGGALSLGSILPIPVQCAPV